MGISIFAQILSGLSNTVLFNLFARVEHLETFYWLAEPLSNNILVVLRQKHLLENTIKNW